MKPLNDLIVHYCSIVAEEASPWVAADRDYTYDELLQRVFDIMRDKNPTMVAGEKRKFVMRPPQVIRQLSHKSLN